MSWRSKRAEPTPEEPPASVDEDEVLTQRLAELTHREVALRRITEVVEKQRTSLEERERALARSESEAVAAAEERLTQAIKRAEQAEQRVRELEQQVTALEVRPEPAPAPVEPPPAPAPMPAAELPTRAVELEGTESTYTLQRLERLVHDAQLRGDPQAEEWAYYLPLLREHAEPDGRLPAQFASLVDSIFAD
jgi:ATPase subunit of ABC transporter with duplicated ATPase domains